MAGNDSANVAAGGQPFAVITGECTRTGWPHIANPLGDSAGQRFQGRARPRRGLAPVDLFRLLYAGLGSGNKIRRVAGEGSGLRAIPLLDIAVNEHQFILGEQVEEVIVGEDTPLALDDAFQLPPFAVKLFWITNRTDPMSTTAPFRNAFKDI
jgi:hypothetical protein